MPRKIGKNAEKIKSDFKKKTVSQCKKELKETNSVKTFQDNLNHLMVMEAKLPKNIKTLQKKAYERNIKALEKSIVKMPTPVLQQLRRRQLQRLKGKYNIIFVFETKKK